LELGQSEVAAPYLKIKMKKMKSNFLSTYPDRQILLKMAPDGDIPQVNGHVHTPYSFSAFENIGQIFEMARKEKIVAVGINDFFVADGYEPFCHEALKNNVFPLFNIEFISLLKPEQQQGIRINDPNNPGRCYFSGKGLDYPFSVDKRLAEKLGHIVGQSQEQVKAMIEKCNQWFASIQADIRLNYPDIRKKFAKELVRERHIAKAIRVAVFEAHSGEPERKSLLTRIFGGKEPKSSLSDIPALDNEIRGNLLKSGGRAFVEEDENAFMSLDEVIEIIIAAGGIPCYPVLLDDKNGTYTEYERDPETLYKELSKRNINCLELIPGRNDASHLQRFIEFFQNRDFVILLGTEHNAPEMIPLACDTRDRKPLNSFVSRISYEGACVVAAHQYLRAKGLPGFINEQGIPDAARKSELVKLGSAVIHYTNVHYKV
jgi:hypothetical protein